MAEAPRLLIVPGLNDSGPEHWQSWLQRLVRGSVRVQQDDWQQPDLQAWSDRIGHTLKAQGAGPWIAVAHSFGCLALAHHLLRTDRSDLQAALLVAPADPQRFGLSQSLERRALPLHATVVGSDTDPWMTAGSARQWADAWGAHWLNLGDAGHINTDAGFGAFPLARRWVLAMGQRLARKRRPQRSALLEWSFAV